MIFNYKPRVYPIGSIVSPFSTFLDLYHLTWKRTMASTMIMKPLVDNMLISCMLLRCLSVTESVFLDSILKILILRLLNPDLGLSMTWYCYWWPPHQQSHLIIGNWYSVTKCNFDPLNVIVIPFNAHCIIKSNQCQCNA